MIKATVTASHADLIDAILEQADAPMTASEIHAQLRVEHCPTIGMRTVTARLTDGHKTGRWVCVGRTRGAHWSKLSRGEPGMKILVTGLAAVALTACNGTLGDVRGVSLTVAQQALRDYSFDLEGDARGKMRVNSSVIAVDAVVDLRVTYRGPEYPGEAPKVLWERRLQRGAGKRAYRVRFIGSTNEWATIEEINWEEAQRVFPDLPDARPIDRPEELDAAVKVRLAGAQHAD